MNLIFTPEFQLEIYTFYYYLSVILFFYYFLIPVYSTLVFLIN